MSIDSNILPRRGAYRGIDYSDRYTTLVNNSNFWETDLETGRRSWYFANAYTTYIGGDGVLNSRWDTATYTSTGISGSPSLEGHPVNISLAVGDIDGAPLWGNVRAGSPGHNSKYTCPAIAFDPNTICIDIRAIVATQSTGGSEGWDTDEVAFKNIEVDSIYEGIMETGVNTVGNRVLVGYKFNFYVGTDTERTFTNRLAVVAENAPPCPENWSAPENFYFFACSNNSVTSGVRISNLYQYSRENYGDGCKAARKLDAVNAVCIDANGAPAATEAYELENSLPTGYGAVLGSGWWYNKGRYTSAGDQLICACIPGEFVLKTAAATGLFFTTVTSLAESGIIGALTIDPDIHIGKMNEDGYTTGEYYSGSECGNAPQVLWTNAVDDAAEAGYTPLDPSGELPVYGDPTIYDDDNTTVLSVEGVPNTQTMYTLNTGDVTGFISAINDVAAALSSEIETVQKFITNDPLEAVSALVYYPFDVKDFLTDTGHGIPGRDDIVLGNIIMTGVEGRKIQDRVVVWDAGQVTYYPPDGVNDFRSYSPYSSATLYIPYCGAIDIDPGEYIGHVINVKYLVDLASGSCLALVYRDGLAVESIGGTIGVTMALSGYNTASIYAANKNAERERVNARLGAAAVAVGVAGAAFTAGSSLALAAAAVGGTAAIAGAYGRIEQAEYNLDHQHAAPKHVGSSSPACSMAAEQCCRLVIRRPRMLDNYDAEAYGRTEGHACCINTALRTFAGTGFVQVSAADLSGIPCTAAERAAISSALQSGVIL